MSGFETYRSLEDREVALACLKLAVERRDLDPLTVAARYFQFVTTSASPREIIEDALDRAGLTRNSAGRSHEQR